MAKPNRDFSGDFIIDCIESSKTESEGLPLCFRSSYIILDVWFCCIIFNSCKGAEYCFEYNAGSFAWNCHADLFPHTLLASHKFIVIGESLQPCPLAICKRARFCPMIDVCPAAAAARHGVGGLFGV